MILNQLIRSGLRQASKFTRRTTPFLASHRVRNFAVLDQDAVADLFAQYAKQRDGIHCLDKADLRALRVGIGKSGKDDEDAVCHLFQVADLDGNGVIDLEEFMENARTFLENNPARIILVVGGPGSGKGVLCRRLAEECNVIHLSSGDLLRQEVERQTALGKEVQDIMARGGLVSSAIIVALIKKRMRDHPGKRVLLDGFPRSLENARDLKKLCGVPELALHLDCDDTVMLERIMGRGNSSVVRRQDDNFQTAIQRIRTYRSFHNPIMDWLQEQHVPVVNLDCAGPPDTVWMQLVSIGRLMRPAVKIPSVSSTAQQQWEQEQVACGGSGLNF